jgi:8-oxo-dGTP diphosphatase
MPPRKASTAARRSSGKTASPKAPKGARTAAPPPQGFEPLKTERLTLRPFRPEDGAELHRLINDWKVSKNLAAVPFPYSREIADAWIRSSLESLEAGRAFHLVISGTEGERETIVGGIGLRIDAPAKVGRIGYWVGSKFWRHGVATEAAGRLARWALANLPLDRLVATSATDNAASIAVLNRIGFRKVGDGVETFEARGYAQKVMHFEATRDDLFGKPEGEIAADGSKPLLLVAACALIDADGRVLLARRPEGKTMAGLWEFPGGKMQAGETPEAALIRELREELGVDVAATCLAPFAFASHPYDGFHLLMPLFLCRRWKGRPQGREGQALAWVRPEKLADYPMPEADRPLVPLLRDFL